MIKSLIARAIYEPLYSLIYIHDKRLLHYAFMKKFQWKKEDEVKKIQAHRLFLIIKHASDKIPYYQELMQKNNITISEKTIYQDIKKIPVLTKEILQREFYKLQMERKKEGWFYNTSGGSTGEPVKVIQDKEYDANLFAVKRLQESWTGLKFGETIIKLWGSEHDLLKQKKKRRNRFSNWMKSIYLLNSYSMSQEDMADYVKIINKKKPKMILAYSQSINELSKYIEEKKINIHTPQSIMTTATMLHPHFRSTIEHVFKCPVFNRYGSREVGDMACECEKHEGLHISMFTHYIEILNEKMEPCKEGEKGEIYVTLLTNFTMPLIRYKIGDLAIHTNKKCTCGRGMPMIKEVTGRTVDYFITRNGKKIDGLFFEDPVWKRKWIIKYQIVQKKYDLIEYRLITKYKPSKDDLKEIKQMIQKVMGLNCRVVIKVVDNIKPTDSGKDRIIFREFDGNMMQNDKN